MFNNLKYFHDNFLEAVKNGEPGTEELKFLFKAFVLEMRCIWATGWTTDS